MGAWERWLDEAAVARKRAGLHRSLVPRNADDQAIDLAGNDYLGLARHPRVIAAAQEATSRWGTGAGASRLVTGTLQLHADLERRLADWMGAPHALVASTGYHANLAAVTALADRDCLIVSDAHIHASLIDAARLSRAEVVVTPHSDTDAVVKTLVERRQGRRALILTESVYSVLGDAAPLPRLAEIAAAHDALLLVDEAHGLGVAGPQGRGLAAAHDLGNAGHVVLTATLSKSLGAQGGAVLGTTAIIDHLVNRARPFIYDTGLAPAPAAAALEALNILEEHPELPQRVAARVAELAARVEVEVPAGAVVSIPMSSPLAALEAQARVREAGVLVGCFRPPSVPDGISRLRVTCSAGLSEPNWGQAIRVLADVL
ncbi:MAG: 8-amino-7-oxononanoate synthase [Nocardioides sp.]|jgi:8-amino-7-oxononanoate synthase